MIEKAMMGERANHSDRTKKGLDFKKRPVVDVRSGRAVAEGLRSALHNALVGFAQPAVLEHVS